MRCSRCGVQLADFQPDHPGEPVCEKCHRELITLAAMEVEQSKKDDRLGWAFGIVAAGAVLPPFFLTGWFGITLDTSICFGFALVAGLAAAIVHGQVWRDRFALMPPYGLATIGALLATWWYVEDRSTIMSIEFFLPLGLGALPGLLAGLGVLWWLKRGAR